MSKHKKEHEVELFNDDEITDDDYGFVIDSTGKLKSMFLPGNVPFKPPKNIAKILKVFGIQDVNNLDNDCTVH